MSEPPPNRKLTEQEINYLSESDGELPNLAEEQSLERLSEEFSMEIEINPTTSTSHLHHGIQAELTQIFEHSRELSTKTIIASIQKKAIEIDELEKNLKLKRF